MTSIGLALCVRDDERTIEKCIRSALPLIDRWTIMDTGSTDRTKEIVQETLAGLPGQLLEAEWVGPAQNRSDLLAVARHGSDYVLLLDSDMELVQEGVLPELTHDAYLIDIRDRGQVYPLPLLTKASKPYYYAGVAHVFLACHEEDAEAVRLRQLALVDHGGGGSRPGKIERDRDLLAAEVARDPSDRRSWFYLAQSYRDLDMVDEAVAAYKFRASLGGWDEEVYYSLYQAGVLLCEHRNGTEGMRLLLEAYAMRPARAEALRALGNVASNIADKVPYPETDVLFVRGSAYKLEPLPRVTTEPEFYDRGMTAPHEPAMLPLETSPWRELYERAARMIPGNRRVVDLGCGTGRFADQLRRSGHRYYRGVDFSPAAIQECRTYLPEWEDRFAVADLRTWEPNGDKNFACLETLEHLEDDVGLVARLPAGATLVFSVPSFGALAHLRSFPDEASVRERYGSVLALDEYVPVRKDGRLIHLYRAVRK